MKGNEYKKTRAIEVIVVIIVVWMLVMGLSITVSFDEIAEQNREMTELEWTYIVDTAYDNVEDIEAIDGSDYFIKYGGGYYNLIDEYGNEMIDGSYGNMEAIGDGYVKAESLSAGIVVEKNDGEKVISVLDKNAYQLSEEQQAEVLARYSDYEVTTEGENINGKHNESKTHMVIDYGRIIGIAKVKSR